MHLFSLIIPVYNTSDFLKECLDSILQQSYKDYEVICVDDGSTDSSFSILSEYATSYSCFKVFKQENQGQSVARNFALTKATGEYIVFVDSDDYINPSMLELLSNAIQANRAQIIMYNMVSVFKDKTKIIKAQTCLNINNNANDYVAMLLNNNLDGYCCNKIYKKTFIDNHNIRFPENFLSEDLFFSFLSLLYANNIYYLDKNLYYYRIHPNSSTQHLNRRIFDKLEVALLIKKYLKEQNNFDKYSKAFDYFYSMSYMDVILKVYNCKQHNELKDLIVKYKKFTNIKSISHNYKKFALIALNVNLLIPYLHITKLAVCIKKLSYR